MSSPKPMVPAKRVWRISADKPMGEWVEGRPAQAIPKPAPGKPEAMVGLLGDADGHWLMSSYDLLSGSDVTEGPDTMPGELFDELFAPARPITKTPGK